MPELRTMISGYVSSVEILPIGYVIWCGSEWKQFTRGAMKAREVFLLKMGKTPHLGLGIWGWTSFGGEI
jgi:hypothetical protein